MINYFSFCISKNVYFTFVLKEVFAECSVLDCQLFFRPPPNIDVVTLPSIFYYF